MEETEMRLRLEIDKWTKKLAEKRSVIALARQDKKDFLQNIDAYISDSQHFFEQSDLVRCFEALVWAWAWLEIGLREGYLKSL